MSANAIVLRTPRGGLSFRIRRRGVVVCVLLVVFVALAGLAGVCFSGDLPVSEVLQTLAGHGSRGAEFIVYSLRMPRLLCALLVGLALGASGAIFQSLSRNPLGSPDIIGFTMGASVGAVLAIALFAASALGIALGALLGALVTAATIYLLAFRNGAQGYRLILVGIGVSMMLKAVVNYLLSRLDLSQALTAQVWLTGSLNGRGWDQVFPVLVAVVVLLPLAAMVATRLDILGMGDDTALALGVPTERTRLWALLLGVALVAAATATAGPVSFVALAAPQLARRLTRSPGVGLLPAALMGASVVVVADWVAQRAFGAELPVGVATGAVGGLYLMWLLSREWRKA